MRYIAVDKLKDGMVLGLPFYGKKFEILLAQGMTLNHSHIRRINDLGYAGVYIMDDDSRDVVVKDVIPAETRRVLIKSTKELLEHATAAAKAQHQNKAPIKVTQEHQQRIIMPIIQALISKSRRLVDMVDLKPYEYYEYYHAANVVILSLLLGVELGVSGGQLYELGMAALLHDVGNVFIPRHILEKPGKLSPEEFEIVKAHSQMGFDFLKSNFDVSIDACVGALQHHEHYDGSGYPNRLDKSRISIYGRIIAITDVFDALCSRRPYRAHMMPSEALAYMRGQSGKMFDPEIVRALEHTVAPYPAGTCVELDSGVRCLVVQNHVGMPDRPRLKVLGAKSTVPMYVDLLGDPNFSGVQVARYADL